MTSPSRTNILPFQISPTFCRRPTWIGWRRPMKARLSATFKSSLPTTTPSTATSLASTLDPAWHRRPPGTRLRWRAPFRSVVVVVSGEVYVSFISHRPTLTPQGLSAALLSLKKRPLIRYAAQSAPAEELAKELGYLMQQEAELFTFHQSLDVPPVLMVCSGIKPRKKLGVSLTFSVDFGPPRRPRHAAVEPGLSQKHGVMDVFADVCFSSSFCYTVDLPGHGA